MNPQNQTTPSMINDQASSVVLDVEIFDPPLCCPTGLCGPALDQNLLDLMETIMELQNEGYQVKRYQMKSSPQAFLSQSEVMLLINSKQMAALPIVLVRGQLLTSGFYPKLVEIKDQLKGKSQ